MAAEVAAQRGELGTAYAVYLKLARDTRDPRLARRATELGLQGRALGESLEAAKLWHELAPRSSEASQTVAMLYAASGQFDAAYAIFSEQLQAAAKPAEELARIQRALTRSQDRAGAFALLERLAQPYGKTAEVRLVLANGAQAAGLNGRAVEEAKARFRTRPGLGARRTDRRTVDADQRSPRRAGPAGPFPRNATRRRLIRGWRMRACSSRTSSTTPRALAVRATAAGRPEESRPRLLDGAAVDAGQPQGGRAQLP